MGPLRAKRRSFGDRNMIFGKYAQFDKVKQKNILFLTIFVFDELGGRPKGLKFIILVIETVFGLLVCLSTTMHLLDNMCTSIQYTGFFFLSIQK